MFSRKRFVQALLVTAVAACGDTDPAGVMAPDGPASGVLSTRPAPTLYSSDGNSHMNDADVQAALQSGFFSSATFGTFSHGGGHYQVAIGSTVEAGMPSDGSTYLLVSSGDATQIRTTNVTYNSCAAGLCDAGWVDVPVNLPADARKLEFDVRYFTMDGSPYLDPFRAYITAGGVTTKLIELTTESEFGGFHSFNRFDWSPNLHHVVVDVAAHAGTTVTLRFEAADDDDGMGGALDSGAAIDNLRILGPDIVPPVVSGVGASPNPSPVNTNITLTAVLSDATTGGSYIAGAEYSIDGGAWTAMQPKDGFWNTVTEEVTATLPSYATPVVITVCVRGRDAAGNVSVVGGTGVQECTEIAVYDPNAGYVAGAGSIFSPLDAYLYDPTATGSARFGFSSEYKNGKQVPEGRTRFVFRAGGLKFEGTVMEWLVVSGAKAQYKGEGHLNGAGPYKFKLTAWDGDIAGSGTDRFRIKIWQEDALGNETVIYDNERGIDDGADPTTALEGGQIRIKKQK